MAGHEMKTTVMMWMHGRNQVNRMEMKTFRETFEHGSDDSDDDDSGGHIMPIPN